LIELIRILNFIPDERIHVSDLTLDIILEIYKNPLAKLEREIWLVKTDLYKNRYWISLDGDLVEFHGSFGHISSDINEIIDHLVTNYRDEIRDYKINKILKF
jgi:hypothetical protein